MLKLKLPGLIPRGRFSRSRARPENLHFKELPGDAEAAPGALGQVKAKVEVCKDESVGKFLG